MEHSPKRNGGKKNKLNVINISNINYPSETKILFFFIILQQITKIYSLNWSWSENSPLDNELALDVRSGSVGAHNGVELAEGGGGRGEGPREAGIAPDPHLAGGRDGRV